MVKKKRRLQVVAENPHRANLNRIDKILKTVEKNSEDPDLIFQVRRLRVTTAIQPFMPRNFRDCVGILLWS